MSSTWTLVNSNTNSTVNYISCYRNGQTTITNGQALILLDTLSTTALYYSTNKGSTFTTTTSFTIFGSFPSMPVFTYVDSSHKIIYIADGSNNINVSNDGGITFAYHSNVTATNNGTVKSVTCDVTGTKIFALVYNPSNMSYSLYVYSGSSWSQTYTTGFTGGGVSSLICSSNGQYVYMLFTVSPATVLYSTNYGNTINSYTLPTPSLYSKIACNSSGSIVYAISDRCMYISTNYGSSWNAMPGMTEQYFDIATDSTGTYIIVSTINKVYHTKDGGTTWSSFNTSNQSYVTISSSGLDLFAFVVGTGLYYYQYPGPMICFHESTKILTDTGYHPISDLRKGDLIQTADHGFVPIEIIGRREIYHPANIQDRIKDQLYLCSRSKYSNTPIFEDLILTGCHSILVKQFESNEQRDQTERLLGDIYITDNHYRLPACLDHRASVYDKPGDYMIYHFALENRDYYMNYGVYANGLLVETSSLRFMYELSNMDLLCD
jgi:hypothetical protein